MPPARITFVRGRLNMNCYFEKGYLSIEIDKKFEIFFRAGPARPELAQEGFRQGFQRLCACFYSVWELEYRLKLINVRYR